jgi:acyl-CoA oxidase
VSVGDIGPKYGRHGNDNGYIAFNKVRIPRENMLSKFSSVSADGIYKSPPSAALAYASTIMGITLNAFFVFCFVVVLSIPDCL